MQPTNPIQPISTNAIPTQNVVVEKTVIKKKGWGLHPIRNTTGCIISILTIGITLFFLLSIVFLGLWLRTWAVFTQERTIGYVYVKPLQFDQNGDKYFSLVFEGEDVEAAFGRLFPWGDKTIKKQKIEYSPMYGDVFQVCGVFFKWKDWLTFLGTPPLYKLSSIRSSYFRSDEFNLKKDKLKAIPINGGEDDFWKSIAEGRSFWNFGAQATYIPCIGQTAVPDRERKFELRVTEDSFILKEV